MQKIKTLFSALLKALLLIILPLSAFGKLNKEVKYIGLPPAQLQTIDRFAAIRIVDFRSNKDTIGVGHCGLGRPAAISFYRPKTLNSYLLERIAFKTSKMGTVPKDTLVIALYAYNFAIDLLGHGIKAFHFDADCYIGGNGKYKSAGPIRIYHEARDYKISTENYVAWMTDSVIKKASLACYASDEKDVDEQFIVNGRAAEFAKVPVYNEKIKDGLYRTVKDYLNNTPSETGEIKWILSDKLDFNLISENGSKRRMKSKDFFLICDKGHLYKADGSINIATVLRKGNEYYFPRRFEGPSTRTITEKYGSMGLLGMAMGSAIDGDTEMKRYYCKIDPRTGEYYQILELDSLY
ncbi:hypothetical protein DN068_11325 [Taibaiella soli]|uniref:WG repeat-containing protein n=2 Tax=Taibaiella soli TaxID=1649169 RepID=A0A2W2BYN5_9BACT|nr:hypothetical protein DN068_11325 [Taibaiella soli]